MYNCSGAARLASAAAGRVAGRAAARPATRPAASLAPDHSQLSRTMVFKTIIVQSILSRTSKQFQIHLEGWRIQIALEAFGLSSYLDSPAFSMDLKL